MSDEYFVEVVASDGLAHHIGPFTRRSTAHAWIKQHLGRSVLPTPIRDMAEKLPAIHQMQSDERLL